MKNDTNNSLQPTLWEDTPKHGLPAPALGGPHVSTVRPLTLASCGRSTSSPTTSASRSRPSTAGARAATDRLVFASASTCAGARRR